MTDIAPDAHLYAAHVAHMQECYEHALARYDLDAVIVDSGTVLHRFLDDQAFPFAPNPHFLHWVPLAGYPDSAVVVRPGRRPMLLLCRPEDYWHQPAELPAAWMAELFDIAVARDTAGIRALLPGDLRSVACIGPSGQWPALTDGTRLNPQPLLTYLHYHRSRKTAWEQACLRRAACMAAPGHKAAAGAFRQGGSEFEILVAFLAGCEQTEDELPYGAIVALGEHGATLHYQHRERERRPASSLLIDAGCAFAGYASDITRTHGDGDFGAMIRDVDDLQQSLCAAVRPGIAFADLHREAHHGIAGLLRRWGLVRMSDDAMVDLGVTAAFFPHGLGHFLGLQVHDTGGSLADDQGGILEPPADFPRLRLLRTLEAGHVVTIEPGIYFIRSLLDTLAAGPHAGAVDWPGVDRLRCFGGIRIEDDVLVTAAGSENLTRPLLGG